MTEKINLLVILGTAHKDSYSEKIAQYLFSVVKSKQEIDGFFLDIKTIDLALTDDGSYKTDDLISKRLNDADVFMFVVPEYNHGYPGSLKIFLDSYFDEYSHKAAGMVGVSNGVFGGARALLSFAAVLRRVGMVVVPKDLYIGNVEEFFNDQQEPKDEKFGKRASDFLQELVWLAGILKEARENKNKKQEVRINHRRWRDPASFK